MCVSEWSPFQLLESEYTHTFRSYAIVKKMCIFIAIDRIERLFHCNEIFWQSCIVGMFGDFMFSVVCSNTKWDTVLEANDENKQRSANQEDFRYVTGSMLTLPHRINNNNTNNNQITAIQTHTHWRERISGVFSSSFDVVAFLFFCFHPFEPCGWCSC